jgi:hypothetical protein
VHNEDQKVARNLNLRLKLTPIAVLDADAFVDFVVELLVNLGRKLVDGLLELVEEGVGVVENLLFEPRFGYQKLLNVSA